MNIKYSKLTIGIAILFEIILANTVIFNIASGQFQNIALLFLNIVCIMLPFIITHISKFKKIVLPSNFKLISLLFIILTLYFGEIQKFYRMFWWWDLILHGMFGSYAVLIALHLMQGIIIKDKEITDQRFIIFTIILAFSFSITLGTLWEIFEFLGDYFFKTDMVNGGLEDTSTDLLVKILFAFITSIICYYRKFKHKKRQ